MCQLCGGSHSIGAIPASALAASISPTNTISGDIRIDSLLYGLDTRWNQGDPLGTPIVMTFSFMEAVPSYYGAVNNNLQGFQALSDATRTILRLALSTIEKQFGVRFIETNDGSAVMQFGAALSRQGGPTYGVNGAEGFPPTGFSAIEGDVILGAGSIYLTATPGSHAFTTILHEIGHSLGLKHPGNYSSFDRGPYLPVGQDNRDNTVMSYSGGSQPPAAQFQPFDVLALQYLYGAAKPDTALFRLAGDTRGPDRMVGTVLNEIIRPGAGDDTVDGGGGIDIVVYSGARSAVAITKLPSDALRIDASAFGEGVDQLIRIERLQFSDGTLKLDSTANELAVARMYQAIMGRAPDAGGLRDWAAARDQGMTTVTMAQGFMGAPEFAQRYGNPDNATFVTLLYQNVLGRAPDEAGFNGWLGALASGSQTRAQLVAGFADSTEFIGLMAARDAGGVFILG